MANSDIPEFKALVALDGILKGITADNELKASEVQYLRRWIQSLPDTIKEHQFVHKLTLIIEKVFEDGVLTTVELSQLCQIIQQRYHSEGTHKAERDSAVNTFLGLLAGVAADNSVNSKEAQALHYFILNNFALHGQWPFNKISAKLDEFYSQGLADKTYADLFLKYIQDISGTNFDKISERGFISLDYLCDHPANIQFVDKHIYFTGTFLGYSPDTLHRQATNYCASAHREFNEQVNLVVVGSLVPSDWIDSDLGQEIDGILKVKSTGIDLTLISEDYFFSLFS